MFESQIYINRRKKLKNKSLSGIAFFLGNVDSPMNYLGNDYPFRQDSTFLYFFGLDFPGLAGVIDFDSGDEYIFGDDVDIEDIIWMGPQVSLKENALKVGIKNTAPFKKISDVILTAYKQGRKIHILPPYRGENKILLDKIFRFSNKASGDIVSVDLIKAVVNLRSVKGDEEIEEIRKACDIGYKMHVEAMRMALPGVREQKIVGRIEGIASSMGGMISYPVILSQNGQILHNHDHSKILKSNRLMLIDAGAETELHYGSDFTRTVPIGGEFTQKQKDIYEIVLAANNRAQKLIRSGVTYLSIHLAIAEVITSALKDLGLMKGDIKEAVQNGAHALFFPHGLGHMLGLDTHDMEDLGEEYVGYDDETKRMDQFGIAYLRLGKKLQKNFVITNEPGIYFIPELIDKWSYEGINKDFINFEKVNQYRDFGGIRLEDNLLVKEIDSEIIGTRIPIEPEEIENVMSKNTTNN